MKNKKTKNRTVKKQVREVTYHLDDLNQIKGVEFKHGYLDRYFLPVDDYFLQENDVVEMEVFEGRDNEYVVSAYIEGNGLLYLNTEIDNFNYYLTKILIYLAIFLCISFFLFFLKNLNQAGYLGGIYFVLNFGFAVYLLYNEIKSDDSIYQKNNFTDFSPLITDNGIASNCLYKKQRAEEILATDFLYKKGQIRDLQYFHSQKLKIYGITTVENYFPVIRNQIENINYVQFKRVFQIIVFLKMTIDDQDFYAHPNELIYSVGKEVSIAYHYNEALKANLILFVCGKDNIQTDVRLKPAFERLNFFMYIFFGMCSFLFFVTLFLAIFSTPVYENMFFLVVMVFWGLLMFFLALHNYKKYKNIKKIYHYKLKEMWMNQLNVRQGSKFIFYY
ncbi:hypothetical protein [Acinetobacter sp. WCHAc060025]|uniref:hypothetical protein n=1 Tax=Acinetobacter sp. WCHAc060025 TaxID=2518625 RepID=UPI00102362BE|nr:hypothetical protein [Acinetobacter sp. WCHAc060025]RZG75770.1 hypothetical protein EXE09_10145 [Acinetobacter sp. WCHAc060025]